MPAMYAHLRFGQEVTKQLPTSLQTLIHSYQDAFTIGLQGPDILFFFQPYKKNKINQLGNAMHKQTATTFLTYAIAQLEENDSEQAHAYLLGFLCHFILDSACHYYVEDMIPVTKTDHYIIESEFEKYLMKKDHIIPQSYDYTKDIPISESLSKDIALFYQTLTSEEITKALQAMRFYKGLLVTKTKGKQALYKACMSLPSISHFKGLLLDFKENPRCQESNDGLYRRFEEAIPLGVTMLLSFEESLQNHLPLHERFNRHFE